jgi:hypothetical protein
LHRLSCVPCVGEINAQVARRGPKAFQATADRELQKNCESWTLLPFENSPIKLLQVIYPEHLWVPWKFKQPSKGYLFIGMTKQINKDSVSGLKSKIISTNSMIGTIQP